MAGAGPGASFLTPQIPHRGMCYPGPLISRPPPGPLTLREANKMEQNVLALGRGCQVNPQACTVDGLGLPRP